MNIMGCLKQSIRFRIRQLRKFEAKDKKRRAITSKDIGQSFAKGLNVLVPALNSYMGNLLVQRRSLV